MTARAAPTARRIATRPASSSAVERWQRHTVPGLVASDTEVVVTMRGHITAGVRLPFTATQRIGARGFAWDATVRLGPLTLLTATDRYEDGRGSMTVRLLGRIALVDRRDEATTRSAATRAALEATCLAPHAVRDAAWHALSPTLLRAQLDARPEHPRVHVRIDRATGAPQAVWAQRWNGTRYVPCGADLRGERRFGPLTLPTHLTVSWGYGTAAARPFFEATITDARTQKRPAEPGAEGEKR